MPTEDQIHVFNSETGKKRWMGVVQFKTLHETAGWKKTPKNQIPKIEDAKSETASKNDSDDNKGTEAAATTAATASPEVEKSTEKTVTLAVVRIKQLGDKKDLDGIKAFIAGDTRVGVINAAKKFLD